ncbi:MAG: DUF4270 domain-containing protein, partial [Hymenobacteraceae bacterium]|nr:DUF4270 domain-containing protein [Hymenobacteraceae bacterium]MDX5395061.1 DUF4270 domain-containing protein [Hymenobacteraceae bacterium]MDX5511097.1 DUF4270 domain-containing protein [Hymenobacteraceae bacterium]
MSLRISKFFLPLLSAAFLFSSCEKPTDIGLGLQDPDDQLGTHFTDTLALNVSTVLLNDSILSTQPTLLLAGVMHDETFGKVVARAYTELNLGSTDLNFGSSSVADSIVLFLNYNYVYGDTTQEQTLIVRKLQENLVKDTKYYTTNSLQRESAELGRVTFKPQPKSSSPLKIVLDKALADAILAESGKATLSSQEEFVKFWKGIVIEPALPFNDQGSGFPKGSIIGFNVAASNTFARLYYTTGGNQRTKEFVITNTNTLNFNQIEADRAGTALAGLVNAGDVKTAQELGQMAFLQQGGGLTIKVEFPNLEDLVGANENIAINKAELILPVKDGTTAKLPAPELLFVHETSGNRPRTMLADQNLNPLSATLVTSNSQQSYRINLTNYIQGIFTDKYQNNGILVIPSS